MTDSYESMMSYDKKDFDRMHYRDIFSFIQYLKKSLHHQEEKERIVQHCPRYARIWYHYEDTFKKPQGNLKQEHELAWALWCVIHDAPIFKDWNIHHDRRRPLLIKLRSKIDVISINHLQRLLMINSPSGRNLEYLALFFEKIVFSKLSSPFIGTKVALHNLIVMRVLDHVHKKVSFHPDNGYDILHIMHPQLTTIYDDQTRLSYFEHVNVSILHQTTNDMYWEWWYSIPRTIFFDVSKLSHMPHKSIGEKAAYLLWNVSSVQKYKHLFKKEMYPILDFYLQNDFLFEDNVLGQDVMSVYHRHYSEREFSLMIC